ncbi:MAG: universal stress protein [Maioricimonas sp. JB049]
MKIDRILLTTDFTDHARSAYHCAADLAAQCGAALHLVHFAGARSSLLPEAAREMLCDALEAALSREAKEHPAFDGLSVEPHLQRCRWTRARQRALERDLDIDLLVMSPQGQDGVTQMLLGSFADRIIRHSSVPVLLFRAADDVKTLRPHTVLAPHDFHERPQAVLPALKWLDRQFSPDVRFLYVYDPTWATAHAVGGMPLRFEHIAPGVKTLSIEDRFEKVRSEDLAGLDVTLETALGYPSEQVVSRANDLPADLVVIATRDGLGSVSRRVTREATCSVLVVPLEDAPDQDP